MIVDLACQPADRVLERGELLIVTADNMALLRFIEDSGDVSACGTHPRVSLEAGFAAPSR